MHTRIPYIIFAFALVVVSAAGDQQQDIERVESAIDKIAASPEQQDESYQRVYEAFTRLMASMSNNSLGNMRRLVSRLNTLVGGSSSQVAVSPATESSAARQTNKLQSGDEKTEQILARLDQVNKDTDQHTLRQLNEDISKLVGTLSDSYLRNIRRVIERVNRVVGQPAIVAPQHQQGDRLEEGVRQPGFPGWDELIVAVDRVQKSLANFVRSSTKLITSG